MNRRGGFLASMVRNLRKLAFGMKEQPTAAVEDFALEHFMLYHGLVGSSPENSRSFKDLRADLRDAVKHQSAVEMSIALKVPPLWWDDKLATIFSELNQAEPAKLRTCLLPEVRADQPAEYDPLKHPDWRVRANTARMIAHVGIEDGVTRIADALHDTTDSVKAAFCHLAYALGHLRGNYAKTALIRHLHNSEPWFRVDAAGALAMFPLDEIASDLLKSILSPNNLSDYTAVVIARRHAPLELLKRTDEAEQDGAMEVVIGILEAAKGTFKSDVVEETNLRAALPQVIALVAQKRTPRRLRAMKELVGFMAPDATEEEKAEIAKTADIYVEVDFKAEIEQWLKRADSPDPNTAGQVRHAIKLAGELHAPELAPHLIPLLKPDFHSVIEVLDSLAAMQDNSAAPKIVELVDQTVNLANRTARPLSKNNVFEEEPEKAKIYWSSLKALGCIPSTESARCLIKATQDFAPDKRQEALKSLIEIASADPALQENFGTELNEAIAAGLQDPASGVRSAALEGVRAFKLVKLLPEVLKVAGAKEVSIYQQSKQVLSELQSAGFSQEIAAAARSRLSSEIDHQKRSRLKQLLDSIPSS